MAVDPIGGFGGEAASDDAPLVLTLQLDEATADFFEAMRRAHYPARLNRIAAHLTLFHQLPGTELELVVDTIAREGRRMAFPVRVAGLMPLGRGVAYRIEAPPLLALRKDLATRFRPWLSGQDRQRFRPHVTIQNKVTPEVARETLRDLSATFQPFEGLAEGLQLWCYRGGPWEPVGALAFR